MPYTRSLSPGIIAAIVILVILLVVAIVLAIYFGIKSSNTTNVAPTNVATGPTGPTGMTGATGPQGATGPASGFTGSFGTPHLASFGITIPSTFPATLSFPLPFSITHPSNYTVDISLPGGPFYGGRLTVYPPSDLYSSLPLKYTSYISENTLYIYIYGITSPVVAGNTATVTIRALLGSGLLY